MSTGTVLRVRAGMKPIATIPHALRTVDVATGETAAAHHQRSDVCAVPAAGVVAEAMVALVARRAVLEKFGGDSVAETRRNLEGVPRRDPGDAAHERTRAIPPSPSMTSPRRAIVLIGPMGSGKTSVGRRVAKALGRRPSSTPTCRRPRARTDPGRSSTSMAKRASASSSARPSSEALAQGGVVSLGGGAVLDPATRSRPRRHRVVLLTVAPHIVAAASAAAIVRSWPTAIRSHGGRGSSQSDAACTTRSRT